MRQKPKKGDYIKTLNGIAKVYEVHTANGANPVYAYAVRFLEFQDTSVIPASAILEVLNLDDYPELVL